MKRFENFTKEDLQALRKEICLNSLFVSDYENSFGISAKSVCDFFDSYMDFIWDIAHNEDNFIVGYPNYGDHTYSEFFEKYDTIDNLWEWYNCYESFEWVEYDDEDDEEMQDAA
jgi:hypothetical protein